MVKCSHKDIKRVCQQDNHLSKKLAVIFGIVKSKGVCKKQQCTKLLTTVHDAKIILVRLK